MGVKQEALDRVCVNLNFGKDKAQNSQKKENKKLKLKLVVNSQLCR